MLLLDKDKELGIAAEVRSATKTKDLLYNGSNDPRKSFHKTGNTIVGDLQYRKPKNGREFKIEAHPAAIERLIKDKLESRIAGATSHGELLRLFRHFDKDGSGEIDLHEFKKMMAAFNVKLTNTAAAQMFKRYDRGGDGAIGYEEFKSQVMGEDRTNKKERLLPMNYEGEKDVDYMLKGGGRGLEMTSINWHSGKIESAPTLVERVLRQKLFERTGAASCHELRRAWNLVDKDGSRRISLDELDVFLKSFNVNLSRRKLKELFARYDVNGDGGIDQTEFENGVLKGRYPAPGSRQSHFIGQDDFDPRPDTARGKVSRALRNGGITGVDGTGHVSCKTKAEEIERTLRVKLRERSDGRSCHELHRIWQQYDKDFDHRVDINEFKQILVAFNIHPSDELLRTLFRRYDANDDGLIERAEFENAILNGILPGNKGRSQTSQGMRTGGSPSTRGSPSWLSSRSTKSNSDALFAQERTKLESHARATLDLLQAAKTANTRVMKLQAGGFSQRSKSRAGTSRSRLGRTVPATNRTNGLNGISGQKFNFSLDLKKAEGL